jgi:hypothetical protein
VAVKLLEHAEGVGGPVHAAVGAGGVAEYQVFSTGRSPPRGMPSRREAISTAFVESTVNQVISKRMVKKQQMRWTPRGAHLLLQVRTRVLNNDLADDFHRWYPNFSHTTTDQHNLAA